MPLKLISTSYEIQASLVETLLSSEPILLGRMGGSDTDAVADWLEGTAIDTEQASLRALRHLKRVQMFNGYYDKDSDAEKFLRFLKLLSELYRECDQITFVEAKLLSMFFPETINERFLLKEINYRSGLDKLATLVDSKEEVVPAYPYSFYERLHGTESLFRVLERVLEGKRVLAITPFEDSIHKNWLNRRKFLKDYSYPEFDLQTLNTPITYAGLPQQMYPHNDWFETCEVLCKRIESHDFDIALMSCGSYAMPLGHHIARNCRRKAIYVGGILQLFFGIIGRRYENPFFLNSLNRDSYIEPVEKDLYMKHVNLPADAAKEHFGAYF